MEALAAFRIGVYAGLRPGEILGLRWQDVLNGRRRTPRLYVRRSYDGPTKTKATRHVPLLPPALDGLRRWKKKAPKNPRDLVFPSDTLGVRGKGFVWGWRDKPETHVSKDGERSKIVRPGIAARAGIERHVTWYSATRHTCASHLLMGTWIREQEGWMTRRLTLDDVRKWLGHADISVTQRYAHLAEDWLDQHLHQ